ncbi:xylulokinase [Lentiprolixibacter aurantiacus]|uniref:FGGY family carbohydrate kinase n=1 Tax=Lentiprolixibacter aurantiacus TaxID=2993939 RepID=A0AAE3MM61_9FLAO|nr:FGGY family carbohydrate kinase [Lentiprolixibacter aurantiacus]MCX2719916.1 FGGY family carbohydrate kinase [Lentiprolixibacter aurantiacus]
MHEDISPALSNYYIGYDIGSSSVKVSLVHAESGESIITIHEPENEMDISSPEAGWAEQGPEEWWTNLCLATRRVIQESGINADQITGIGIAYQMHGLVIVDREGTPLRKSIIWCDSRAVEIGEQAFYEIGEEQCRTHLLNSPGNFTVSKLKWVMENEPDIYKRTYKFMLPGDYIAFKLTGKINTTINGLSEAILWDFRKNKVADWLFDYLELDKSLIPDIVENFTNQGKTHKQASQETGLPKGIPVVYRAGDQPNNALSLNILKPGEVAVSGGTSGVIYAVTDLPESKEISRINSFVHVNYSRQHTNIGKLLCINGCGIMYRWLKSNLGVRSYGEMNELASQVSIGSDGLIIIPFGNGSERMLDNRDVNAHFLNLDLNRHTRSHLCRAALEGIAFSFVYGMEILKNDNTPIEVIRAGNDNLFRSEIFSSTIATLIDYKIKIYNTTGSIGAARAGFIKERDFEKMEELVMQNDYVKSYDPVKERKPYLNAYKRWEEALAMILNNK